MRLAVFGVPAIVLALFAVAAVGFLSRPSTVTAASGDVNCDGDVTAIDALLLLQHNAGLLPALRCASNADTNGDGRVNALDAALVLQHDAGLIGDLPGVPVSPPVSLPISRPVSPPVSPPSLPTAVPVSPPMSPPVSPSLSLPISQPGSSAAAPLSARSDSPPLVEFLMTGKGVVATAALASITLVGATVSFGGLADRAKDDAGEDEA